MQREDWRQIFEEVEREVHGLIVEQQGQIEKAFVLNSGKLDVTFKVTLEEKDSTFDVSVDVSFVKEKIKSGDSKRLVLGQIDIPFAPQQARPQRPPAFDESRMLGAGTPQLEPGEPLHMGAGEAVDANPFKVCAYGAATEVLDVESRLSRVKEMNADQLRAVIALPGCQKSVVKAAERRLKKLEKKEAERSCLNCGNNNPDEEVCSQACNALGAWVAF